MNTKYNELPSTSQVTQCVIKNNIQNYLMTTMSLFQSGLLISIYFSQFKIYGPLMTSQFLKLTI